MRTTTRAVVPVAWVCGPGPTRTRCSTTSLRSRGASGRGAGRFGGSEETYAILKTMAGLIASYGYVVLFLLVGLESLGIPLPGETALVTAAAFAALGHLSISAVIATAVAAAIVGDNGGHLILRGGGPPRGRGCRGGLLIVLVPFAPYPIQSGHRQSLPPRPH